MPLSPEISHRLVTLIKALMQLSTHSTPRRYYSTIFRDLPDPTIYSDYYVFIKEPRALNPIMQSLHNSRYSSPHAVAYDLFLVWSNAREYNEVGSQVYNDADKLQRHMERMWKDMVPPLPPLEQLPRPGMLNPAQAAGSFTTPNSAVGEYASGSNTTAAPVPVGDGGHKRIKIMSSALATHSGSSASGAPSPTSSEFSSMPKIRLNVASTSFPSSHPPPLQSLPPLPHSQTSGAAPLTLKLAIKPPGASASSSAASSPVITPALAPSTLGAPHPSSSAPSPQPAHTPSAAPSPVPTSAAIPQTMATSRDATPNPATGTHDSTSAAAPPPPAQAPVPGPVPPQQHRPSPAPTPVAHVSEPAPQPVARELPNGTLTDVESGWMGGEIEGDPTSLYLEVLYTLRDYTDSEGRRLAAPYMTLSERPEYYDQVDDPVALDTIEARVHARAYESPEMFDRDLFRLFENAKLFTHPGESNSEYADLVVLQRVYQELTKRVSSLTPRPQNLTVPALSSVKLGPGNCEGKDPVDGEPKTAQTRISMKDKIFLDHINFKGQVLRVGDWCHLLNPENPAKPIIAQIFKVYKRMDSPQRCLSVCWYYRPEETIHPRSRTFYEGEVFKSGQFVDHAIEDFIDRCFVMFFTRYIRGRPKAPVWDESLPLYVVEHRYKDEIHSFKKIKNWNSCVPEEIRKQEYALVTFPGGDPVTLPRYPSPFLRGIEGPGRFGEALDEAPSGGAGGSAGKSNEKETSSSNTNATAGRYHSSAPLNPNVNPQPVKTSTPMSEFDLPRPPPSGVAHHSSVQPEELHPLPPDSVGRPTTYAQGYGGQGVVNAPPPPPPMPFLHSAGMFTPVEMTAQKEQRFTALPPQIQSKLRTDEFGDVLWFTTPGLPDKPSANDMTKDLKPTHSLDYLYWKVMQKQQGQQSVAMDVES
ncbi:BZ3500_MvSof-1268-A1-R1_Chr5-2g08052 [Microbotryum saponariae]|uniref:BZ3500_MvSof-1268-A1-R1_Chr5-2g08052 protein n=1 Tax=Microbotryum saponariae TaxID=289078 RepID=A0A2X0LG76_9BASI|nr:BZ3500_MvSof-1268-A1-R1_Chr5-2g08052 [Microbotryum saponariae]SDA05921.1 BZ3501_MvSof-1269-A2-R1_Chr5-2g07874 [Microbotryum saponariae]